MQEFFGKYSSGMSLADLHIHTKGSDGLMEPNQVVDLADALGLTTIAITDHEIIDPAVEALEYAQKKGSELEIIIGTEITTSEGHLVGLYLQENIPSGKSADWTIQQIHDQGGLVVAPHPVYKWTRSLNDKRILSIIKNPDPEIYFDGFEIFNAGVYDNPHTKANLDAKKLFLSYSDYLGSPLGGTDTHFYTIGRGLTGFRGNLREAIESKQTAVFYLDKREQIQILELAQQLFYGLVLEPKRRLERYAQRELNGSLEV